MRRIILSAWLGLLAHSLCAAEMKLPTLKVGSKTYRDVTLIGANATDLYFKHRQGISNVKLKFLDPELQKKFRFNPVVAAEMEAQQVTDDARYIESLAQVAADTAKKKSFVAAASEDSLLDSISDKSLINKPAPELAVEKWLGDKPDLKERFVLIFFWTTWSAPSRRAIPELNAYYKKFGDKLAIVGLSSETERDLSQAAEPKIEFSSGIDTQGRFSTLVGATSVPYIMVIDPKGIVRYQGHPAAINEKTLQALIAKYSS